MWKLAALITALVMMSTLPVHSVPVASNALWVWDEPAPSQVRLAVRKGFDTLYVQLRPHASRSRQMRKLLRHARRRDVAVWAMGGRKEWTLDPEPLVRFVREARRVPGIEGIVLDIEPHALPEWKVETNRRRLMRAFLRRLDRARTVAGDTPVLAAVPFWFDHDGYRLRGRTLTEHVLDRTDGIIVLAYRDRAEGTDGILTLAGGEVRAASRAGKTAVIAVQTADDELDKLGFFEEGRRAMERELELVRRAFATAEGFGGLSVHHLDSYRALRP